MPGRTAQPVRQADDRVAREERDAAVAFRVFVDDNFHYMDDSYRITLGDFDTLEAAIAAARARVDECLQDLMTPGLTADQLFRDYMHCGDDPFVVVPDTTDVLFSARNYARERCEAICRPPTEDRGTPTV